MHEAVYIIYFLSEAETYSYRWVLPSFLFYDIDLHYFSSNLLYPYYVVVIYISIAHLHMSWSNGPSEESVKRVAGHFRGSRFDGMTDMKCRIDSPYGNDYIFFRRELSQDLYLSEVRRLCAEYGFELPDTLTYDNTYQVMYQIGRQNGSYLELEKVVERTIQETDYF
jgi:hypothetical protein